MPKQVNNGRLYDADGRYTYDAFDIDEQATRLLAPLVRKYTDMGYGVHEIAHLICVSLYDLEMRVVLGDDIVQKPLATPVTELLDEEIAASVLSAAGVTESEEAHDPHPLDAL